MEFVAIVALLALLQYIYFATWSRRRAAGSA